MTNKPATSGKLKLFAKKMARSAVGQSDIKEAISDVRNGRVMSEKDFFVELEREQKSKKLRRLTDLIPVAAVTGLKRENTTLEHPADRAALDRPRPGQHRQEHAGHSRAGMVAAMKTLKAEAVAASEEMNPSARRMEHQLVNS